MLNALELSSEIPSPRVTASWIWLTVVNLPEGKTVCAVSPSFMVNTRSVTAAGKREGYIELTDIMVFCGPYFLSLTYMYVHVADFRMSLLIHCKVCYRL